MKVLAPALLLFALVACQTTPVHPPFRYAAELGIAIEKAGHSCLYVTNAGLLPGHRVQFVSASSPQTSGEMEILGKADEACTDANNQTLSGVHRYGFKVVRGELKRSMPAFAILNSSLPLTATEDGVAADLEGDGGREFFRTCTSAEGVHFTVWTGKPLLGSRKWHSYYYLGYDVTANCSESETKPDTER